MKELTFVRDILSSEGIAKIVNMQGRNARTYKELNGIINYMEKFIPNLSEHIAPLR